MHLQIAPQNTSLSPLCSPLHTSHPSQCLKGTFPLIPCQYWDLILSNLYSFARWKTPHLSHVIFMIIFSRDLGSACLMGEPILNFGFCGFYPLLLTSFWNLHFLIERATKTTTKLSIGIWEYFGTKWVSLADTRHECCGSLIFCWFGGFLYLNEDFNFQVFGCGLVLK